MRTAVGLKPRKDLISRYKDLSLSLFALRRKVPRLQVLGISLVHPRHSIPPEQLRLLDDIEKGTVPKPPSIVFMM